MTSKKELELRIARLELAMEDVRHKMVILANKKKKTEKTTAKKSTTKKSNIKGVY